MAESIKFDDKYIDTTGVYDSTLGKTMRELLTQTNLSITGTDATDISYNGGIRIGSMVLFYVYCHLKGATASGTVLCSGLPATTDWRFFSLAGDGSGSKIAVIKNGTLELSTATTAAEWISGSVVYMTTD